MARPVVTLALLCAACLSAAACSTTTSNARDDELPAAAAAPPPPPAPPIELMVDASMLFPMSSSRSHADARAVTPSLLSRLVIDAKVLAGDGADDHAAAVGVEPWLGRALFRYFTARGSEVRTGGAGTAALPVVRFGHLKERPKVVVTEASDGTITLGYRDFLGPNEHPQSLCADDFSVPIVYVQLEGVLVDANQRTVAVLAEAAAAEPREPRLKLRLPADAPLCPALAAAFDDGGFAADEQRLNEAAHRTLDSALRALVDHP